MKESIKDKVIIEGARLNIKVDHMNLEDTAGDLPTSLKDFINDGEKMSIDYVILGTNGTRAEANKGHFAGRTMTTIVQGVLSNLIVIP